MKRCEKYMSKFMNTAFPYMDSQYQYSQVTLNAATSYSALEGVLSLEESFMDIEPVSEGVWDSIQSFFKKKPAGIPGGFLF